jgi:hypothetical protein
VEKRRAVNEKPKGSEEPAPKHLGEERHRRPRGGPVLVVLEQMPHRTPVHPIVIQRKVADGGGYRQHGQEKENQDKDGGAAERHCGHPTRRPSLVKSPRCRQGCQITSGSVNLQWTGRGNVGTRDRVTWFDTATCELGTGTSRQRRVGCQTGGGWMADSPQLTADGLRCPVRGQRLTDSSLRLAVCGCDAVACSESEPSCPRDSPALQLPCRYASAVSSFCMS